MMWNSRSIFISSYLVWIFTFNICESIIPKELEDVRTTGKVKLPPWEIQMQNIRNYLCPLSKNTKCDVLNELIDRIESRFEEKLHIISLIANDDKIRNTTQNVYPVFGVYFGENIINEFIIRYAFGHQYGLYLLFHYAIQSETVQYSIDLELAISNQLKNFITSDDTIILPESRTWILQHIILPLLPSPSEKLDVYSSDFAYAMASKIFIKSTGLFSNFTTDELILISEGISYFAHSQNSDQSVLNIFAIPALIQYTYAHIENNTIALDIINGVFNWNKAYHEMFTTFENIRNNVFTKYNKSASVYHSRSSLAELFITSYCTTYVLTDEVVKYKNQGASYKCPNDEGYEKFPDVNELFLNQINAISEKYKTLEETIITDNLRYHADLRLIDDSKIFTCIIRKTHSANYYPDVGLVNDYSLIDIADRTVDLFALLHNDTEWKYYAIVRDEGQIKIITFNKMDKDPFYKSVMRHALKTGLVNIVDEFTIETRNVIKQPFENVRVMARMIAKERAILLLNAFFISGYDETKKEKILRFFKSLVPLHDCYVKMSTAEYAEGAIDCTLDIVSIAFFAGEFTKIGATIFEKVILGAESSFVKGSAIKTIQSVLADVALATAESFTRENIKKIVISLLRSFDPGFELVFTLSKKFLTYLIHLGNYLPAFGRISYLLNKKYNAMIEQLKLEYDLEEAILQSSLAEKNAATSRDLRSYCKGNRIRRNEPAVVPDIGPESIIIDKMPVCTTEDALHILKSYMLPTREAQYFFAQSITASGRLPEWAANLWLRFPNLIYAQEAINLIETQNEYRLAWKAIQDLYSTKELANINVNMYQEKFFKQFNFHSGLCEHYMSVEDYYAIRNYGGKAKQINDKTNEAKHMRNALRRLTIRQSTRLNRGYQYEGYTSMTVSRTSADSYHNFQFIADNHFKNRFTPLTTKWGYAEAELEEVDEGLENAIFRINVDYEWMVADLRHILQDQFVLHPHFQLTVEDVEEFFDEEIPYTLVSLVATEWDRAQTIPHLMNEIE